MAIGPNHYSKPTTSTGDKAPRHAVDGMALRDVARAHGDRATLEAIARGELPPGWDPRYMEVIGPMAEAAIGLLRDGDRNTYNTPVEGAGMNISPEKMAAQRAAAANGPAPWHKPPVQPEATNSTHGKIGITLMLRFVLATIADREERETEAQAAETQILPTQPDTPAPADADLVARHANGSSTRPLTLGALTRLGATNVGNTPTVIISTTNLSALRPVSPAVGN